MKNNRNPFIFFIFTSILIFAAFCISPPLNQREDAIYPPNLISPSLTREDPFSISYDNYSGIASSGSGIEGDPWIIENFFVESNGSGTSIGIEHSTDYAVFRNFEVNESGSGVLDHNIGILNSSHITFQNATLNDSGKYNFGMYSCNEIDLNNVTITYSIENGMMIDSSDNCYISNSHIQNSSTNAIYINGLLGYSHFITLDNVFVNESTNNDIRIQSGNNYEILNCELGNASGGETHGIKIQNVNNVFINNSYFHDLDMGIQLKNVTYSNYTYNNMTELTLDGFHAQDEEANHSYFGYNIIGEFDDPAWIGDGFAFTNCENNTFHNNTLYGSQIDTTDSGFAMRDCHNDIYTSNAMVNFDWGFRFPSILCTNSTIANNTFENNTLIGLYLENANNVSVEYNTFINNTIACRVDTITDLNFTYNNFTINPLVFYSENTNINISFNWFHNNTEFIENENFNNWSHNYYRDYFEQNPYAITDLNRYILLDNYNVTGSIIDDYPLYHEPWFKVSKSMAYHFYSNLDFYGLTFEWVKLYVDDEVIVRMDPIETDTVFKVKVTDFAGSNLYEVMHNVNSTLDLDIGLNVTWLKIHNKFDREVIFHYIVNDKTISYPMGANEIFTIRVALDTYHYWVTDQDDEMLEDEDGEEIIDNITIEGVYTLSFGWIEIPEEEEISIFQAAQLNWIQWIAIILLLIGFNVTLFSIALYTRRSSRNNSRSKGVLSFLR